MEWCCAFVTVTNRTTSARCIERKGAIDQSPGCQIRQRDPQQTIRRTGVERYGLLKQLVQRDGQPKFRRFSAHGAVKKVRSTNVRFPFADLTPTPNWYSEPA